MCVTSCLRALACMVVLFLLAVISFVVIFVGRCWAAGSDYVANHPDDWSVSKMLESSEFWDMDNSAYWEVGLIWWAVMIGILLLIFFVICIALCLAQTCCDWHFCERLALCIDCCGPKARRWRRRTFMGDRFELDDGRDWEMLVMEDNKDECYVGTNIPVLISAKDRGGGGGPRPPQGSSSSGSLIPDIPTGPRSQAEAEG